MAHFRFRLETLLRYREHLAEQAEYEVARLAAEEQSLRAAIEQLHRRMLDEQEQSTTTAAHHLQMLDAHRRSLAEQIRTLEQELDAVRTERERAEQRLIERMQERDVLGRLRQRRYEEFALEQRRHEQRQLDEIAARRHRNAPSYEQR
ncbi:hypothetical protein HRbin20_01260 [bacterium HR20]|nr:hypothetical protein HRbin20_01260 [bacterium HR20]